MKKEQKFKIVLPILMAVSVLVWFPSFVDFKKLKDIKESNQLLVENSNIVNQLSKFRIDIDSNKSAYESWSACPFSKEVFHKNRVQDIEKDAGINRALINKKPMRSLELKGIFFNKERPCALINEEILGKGDVIGSSTVVSIDYDKVILNDGQEDFELIIEK
ncbi:MAG: hypothetical protein P9X22_05580 [Candidatus Zapsychrus exili]|nr:hypothetical protein [Candidatus Zapsychrus exili]